MVARLARLYPPPKTFKRYDVLRRTPWFPVWWFDDLVARGYLIDERADNPERQGRYRVSPEQAEPPPGADDASSGGELRAVIGGGDGGADGGGDGGEKKEAGSVERGV